MYCSSWSLSRLWDRDFVCLRCRHRWFPNHHRQSRIQYFLQLARCICKLPTTLLLCFTPYHPCVLHSPSRKRVFTEFSLQTKSGPSTQQVRIPDRSHQLPKASSTYATYPKTNWHQLRYARNASKHLVVVDAIEERSTVPVRGGRNDLSAPQQRVNYRLQHNMPRPRVEVGIARNPVDPNNIVSQRMFLRIPCACAVLRDYGNDGDIHFDLFAKCMCSVRRLGLLHHAPWNRCTVKLNLASLHHHSGIGHTSK